MSTIHFVLLHWAAQEPSPSRADPSVLWQKVWQTTLSSAGNDVQLTTLANSRASGATPPVTFLWIFCRIN